jgi:hypothetical protein
VCDWYRIFGATNVTFLTTDFRSTLIIFRFRFPKLWHDTRSALLAAGTYKFVFEEKEAAEPAKEADAVEQSA